MRYTCLPLVLSLALAVVGCSSKSTMKSEGQDPAEYARATKQQVLQFVKSAKENPKSARGDAEALLERLQVYTSRPVGDNQAIYEQLVKKCQDLISTAKRSPGSGDVSKKLDELAALANKLPG
jgi:Txe/YoeB family toxin of Txe-Axe toxin-antitoxin module